jgi:hypothetical protein
MKFDSIWLPLPTLAGEVTIAEPSRPAPIFDLDYIQTPGFSLDLRLIVATAVHAVGILRSAPNRCCH